MAGQYKRETRRVPVVLRIKLRYQDVDTFIEKFAINISHGGMFIRSRSPKAIGTVIKFELCLADEQAVIAGYGTVRWVNPYDPARPRAQHGMGIEFTRLTSDSRVLISRVVEHKRALGLMDDDSEIPLSRFAEAAPEPTATTAAETAPAMMSPEPAPATAPEPTAAVAAETAPDAVSPELAPEPAPEATIGPDITALIASACPRESTNVADVEALLASGPQDYQRALARARALAASATDATLAALRTAAPAPTLPRGLTASAALAAVLVRRAAGSIEVDTMPAPDAGPSEERADDPADDIDAAGDDELSPVGRGGRGGGTGGGPGPDPDPSTVLADSDELDERDDAPTALDLEGPAPVTEPVADSVDAGPEASAVSDDATTGVAAEPLPPFDHDDDELPFRDDALDEGAVAEPAYALDSGLGRALDHAARDQRPSAPLDVAESPFDEPSWPRPPAPQQPAPVAGDDSGAARTTDSGAFDITDLIADAGDDPDVVIELEPLDDAAPDEAELARGTATTTPAPPPLPDLQRYAGAQRASTDDGIDIDISVDDVPLGEVASEDEAKKPGLLGRFFGSKN